MRPALSMFFERKGQRQQELMSAIDMQHAIQMMGEFDGFSGIAALSG